VVRIPHSRPPEHLPALASCAAVPSKVPARVPGDSLRQHQCKQGPCRLKAFKGTHASVLSCLSRYTGADPGSLAALRARLWGACRSWEASSPKGLCPSQSQSLVVLYTGRRGLTWDNIQELYLCSTVPGTRPGVPLVPHKGYASVALPQSGGRPDVEGLLRMQALSASISAAAAAQGALASPPPPSPPPSPPQPPSSSGAHHLSCAGALQGLALLCCCRTRHLQFVSAAGFPAFRRRSAV